MDELWRTVREQQHRSDLTALHEEWCRAGRCLIRAGECVRHDGRVCVGGMLCCDVKESLLRGHNGLLTQPECFPSL